MLTIYLVLVRRIVLRFLTSLILLEGKNLLFFTLGALKKDLLNEEQCANTLFTKCKPNLPTIQTLK